MMHVGTRIIRVRIPPDFQISAREFFRNQGVKFESRAESSADFLKVLDFEY